MLKNNNNVNISVANMYFLDGVLQFNLMTATTRVLLDTLDVVVGREWMLL